MLYEVEVNGQIREVSVTRREHRYVVAIGDREWTIDAAHVGPHVVSLLIEGEHRLGTGSGNGSDPAVDPPGDAAGTVLSREISVGQDSLTGQFIVGVGTLPVSVGLNTRRRWGRRDDSGGAGPQRIVAPMPGKVVRVLARKGDTVAHRQPVVVIEAMKMENELRAARDGAVTDLFVQEGQSVEAGTLLAIITPA